MKRAEQITRWRSGLRNRLPIIGAILRRRTVKALAEQRDHADVIPLLVEALKSPDARTSDVACHALSGLTEQTAVNALCEAWVRSRDRRLADFIVQRAYVASAPDRVRVLSALKSGKLEPLFQATGPMADIVVTALDDADHAIAENARRVLQGLKPSAALDAVCLTWVQSRDVTLGGIISEQGYVAGGPPKVRTLSGLKSGRLDLLHDAGAEIAVELIAALDDGDMVVAQNAERVLYGVTATAGVNALCSAWANSRDERLASIIRQRDYVATAPIDARILSALKCGKRVAADREDVTRLLIQLLSDKDDDLRSGALKSLERIQPGAATETLCEETIRHPQSVAAKLCLRLEKRPADHERLCLFLFVTRQLDDYFREDFEFQNLRLEYDRAAPEVRQHVMDVVRSGDRRCLGFFGTRSKPLTECNEQEIRLALDSWRKHHEWPPLFQACLELPLKYSLQMFTVLDQAGWEPDLPEMRSLFRQVVAEADDQVPPAPAKRDSDSTLLEAWLAKGRTGELSRRDESALRNELAQAIPPRGVEIVGALAAKATLADDTVRAVQTSPHWLVRLAGHVTGIYPPELTQDDVVDPNYWITELATAKGVWDFWPWKATPRDLARLSAAPPEAFAGRLGKTRRALQILVGHQVTSGVFQPMVVEVAEDAGQFQLADDADLPPPKPTGLKTGEA